MKGRKRTRIHPFAQEEYGRDLIQSFLRLSENLWREPGGEMARSAMSEIRHTIGFRIPDLGRLWRNVYLIL
jgi:hypothetical protein